MHIHGWNKALSPSVLRAAERSGVPTVQTLHDYVAVCPNGALYDFVKQRNCPLRPMSLACIRTNCDARNYGHKLWRVARQATLSASSGTSGVRNIIYMLERQRQILAPHLPDDPNLHWVSNPVGAEDHGPADVARNDAFVYVGRLSREKGVVLFAEAASRAGLPAVFVGDGPARAEVAAAAPEAIITGWVENDVVAKHLRHARAVVFPSLWYETFGLAVYEALAAGVPPVVSDNAVSAGAIEHGVNGLLFANGNVDDLVTQLDALRDPALAARTRAERPCALLARSADTRASRRALRARLRKRDPAAPALTQPPRSGRHGNVDIAFAIKERHRLTSQPSPHRMVVLSLCHKPNARV